MGSTRQAGFAAALLAGALLTVGLAPVPATAQAPANVIRLTCETTFQGVRVSGQLEIMSWVSAGAGPGESAVDRAANEGRSAAYAGRMVNGPHQIDGIFVVEATGTQIGLSAFSDAPGSAVGSFWYNGQSHRATYMTLIATPAGFDIITEDRQVAHYTCR